MKILDLKKLLKTHIVISIFLLFYFLITTYKFMAHPTPFYDWDESIYAQVGREMVQQKSLIPLWQGQFWLDKPPLVPLTYGIVETITPLQPELSTRLFTLSLTMFLFALIYYFYFRLTKNSWIAFLTVIISAFTQIMLQRTQVLNVDIFLFLGWMGYLVFYENFWLSFLFLIIGVMSKSVLGFYPALGYLCILGGQILLKQKTFKQQKKQIITIVSQMLIVSVWFIIMFIRFKFPFIQAQFIDSQLKRVTSSIESHFGKRTFYIDLLFKQLSIFAYLSLVGIVITFKDFFKKKDLKQFILSVFFVPWFLFLNLTKTKINWYLYPVIPQFAFLGILVLQYIRNRKTVLLCTSLIITFYILYVNFSNNLFLNSLYSTYDEQYYLAMYAKTRCEELTVLVDKDTRTTHDTLKGMNLLIHTSEWWGNHPALVYYTNERVNFIYSLQQMQTAINAPKYGECLVIYNTDSDLLHLITVKTARNFTDLSVYTKANN